MQEKLVAFIRQQIHAGHDINSVKNHLLGVGYSPTEVNSAIGLVTGGAAEGIKQKLAPFIAQQKHLGYDENSVRVHLVKSGYPAEIVHKAVNEVYEEHAVSPKVSKLNFTIIGGIAAVMLAVVGIVMLFTGGEEAEPGRLLDFSVDTATLSIKPGANLDFSFELTSMGSFKRFDMQITHKIYDANNKAITFKKETVAVETRVSKTTSIPIPLTAKPGLYRLESIVRYNGQTAEASFDFEIEPRVEVEPEVEGEAEAEAEGEEGEAEAEAEAEAEEEIQIPEGEITFESIEMDVKKYSAQPGKDNLAADLCELLQEQRERDTCYLTIAEVSKLKSYCQDIQNNYRKDVCYITFQRDGDFTVCDLMEDVDLRTSCKAMEERGVVTEVNITNVTNVTVTNVTEAPNITTVPSEGEAESEAEGEGSSLQERFEQISALVAENVSEAKALCASFTDTDERDQCYIIIINLDPDTAICDFMSTAVKKDQCYLNYVVKVRDESVCDLIQDEILKQQCGFLI